MTGVSDPAREPSEWDERFMRLAIALGRRNLGLAWPNPSVGALIVEWSGDVPIIVAQGVTQLGGRPHAERVALAAAGERARGATLYVSLEPCSHHGKTSPCADAVVEAGVARVVSALQDPDSRVAGYGHARLREVGIDFEAVTKQLEREGVDSFAKSFDQLIAGVEKKRQALQQAR